MTPDPNADFCYVTTTGRVSRKAHTIEIWFALEAETLYILSGGRERSDWVRNTRQTPAVSVRIGETAFEGNARIVEPGTDEDALARRLLVEKYGPRYSGDLSIWGRTALPVAIDLVA